MVLALVGDKVFGLLAGHTASRRGPGPCHSYWSAHQLWIGNFDMCLRCKGDAKDVEISREWEMKAALSIGRGRYVETA